MADSILRVQQLNKTFDSRPVLRDLSLSIPEGCIFGLLGPSGAGKTTLIRLLTGQISPDSGTVEVLGQNPRRAHGWIRRQTGIMADGFGLSEGLTCFENLSLFCSVYGLPVSHASELLARTGLEGAARTLTRDLSRGMLQRLNFCRAVLHSPQLLFLDEPTASLDPETARLIHHIILELRDRGTTVFLTTHRMEEASRLCETVGLIHQGVLAELGSPGALCQRHQLKTTIRLTHHSGEVTELAHTPENADVLCAMLRRGDIAAMHTTEPDLEQVFLKVTGVHLHENC